ALTEEGIEVHTGVGAKGVSSSTGGIEMTLGDGRTLRSERLLVATGRKTALGSLGVGAAGLDEDARSLEVDGHMRAADGIWAIGDVTAHGGFTHVAVYQGRIAAADILGQEQAPADYSAVPRVTFTDPEVASVGFTEESARAKGITVATAVAQTGSSARGWIHGPGAEHGVTKLVADADAGVIIGASSMGPRAGDVIGMLVLAIKERVPISSLKEMIYPYPTFVRGVEDALREFD
ncbi:MAG: NAD(P)/FAD-dependent oxidoreductase, partial [Actinobacteria bacterium]|nr:NAD(P)/FAD-dependent oxidoreductase [Actinomycetota bacterium]